MQAVEQPTSPLPSASHRVLEAARAERSRAERRGRTIAILQRLPGASGIVAALLTMAGVGTADGAVTFLRVPVASRTAEFAGAVLFHCIAVMLPVGVVLGIVQEIVMRGSAGSTSARDLRVFLRAGPSAWFETNVGLSARFFGVEVGLATLIAVVLVSVDRLVARIREPSLVALSVLGAVLFALACAAFATLLAERLATRVLPLASRFASPGVTMLASGILLLGLLRAVAEPYTAVIRTLGAAGVGLLACVVGACVIDAALLVAVRSNTRFRARAGVLTVASLIISLGMVVTSGWTLGRDQAVLSTILHQSIGARHLVGPLQHWMDRDGDGFGRWFGGGDCDDGDPRKNPAAIDVPGNGVDENCSGADATTPASAPAAVRSVSATPEGTTSVLLVSVDAMRPDHMSVYGYHRPTTPVLARFAERAVRFTDAYTTSPQSVRSIASVFTGRHAASLVWRQDPRFPHLDPSNTTLAEALRLRGYATAAFLNTSYFSLTAGFFQGFELVQEGALFKDDERVTISRAVAWLDERRRDEEPFLAWVHLINPHAPYGDRTAPEDFGHEDVDRYDEELAGTDAALESLFGVLDRLERDGHSVLTVVFSDHGEAFGEHGHQYHADCLYDEVLRVPLLIRARGAPTAETRALVSLVDLHATALSFAGVAHAADGASRSLVRAVLSPETCRHNSSCIRESIRAEVVPTYGSTAMMRTIVAPPWKLIHDAEHGAWELYNRSVDSPERNNVYDVLPARAALLRARLLDSGD